MNHADLERPCWFCIRSQQKHEQIAAVHLRRIAGVEVFCPRVRLKRDTRVGAKWFTEAMFPGYLFARFILRLCHKEVRYATGVASILQFGDRHAIIDDEVIDSLRQHTNEQELTVLTPDLSTGSEVKIIDGSLRGLEAVVTQALPSKERLRILMTFLGRQVEAEIHKDALLPVAQHPSPRKAP
jgi:transcriptional antiterminator RfaH